MVKYIARLTEKNTDRTEALRSFLEQKAEDYNIPGRVELTTRFRDGQTIPYQTHFYFVDKNKKKIIPNKETNYLLKLAIAGKFGKDFRREVQYA